MPPEPAGLNSDRKRRVDELIDWLSDPANEGMFDSLEDRRAAERGRCTDRMIERGAKALCERLGGRYNPAMAGAHTWRGQARCVLEAALAFDEVPR